MVTKAPEIRRPQQFILAETPIHARHIAARADWSPFEWTFVDRPDRLQGRRGAVLWVYETARRRRDYEEVMLVARALGMRLIAIGDCGL
ncbi:hypothetical protein [Burkholderia sp. Bp8990]|uniref:hypothetical protein n=1 Tax=Burkholderia sp. Bp8990 TaxID=2184552 RepID=UPI000F5A75B7|nr:hypothetical protein [Burkholderia sp. Bp8990]RQS39738.1 hypothetical protein DIE01_16100 [Burkholderia sp. Bp8990]